MAAKRLGAASVVVSISDDDGFKVVHGTDGTVLCHIPADQLDPGDWNRFWGGIHAVEHAAAVRKIEKEAVDQTA